MARRSGWVLGLLFSCACASGPAPIPNEPPRVGGAYRLGLDDVVEVAVFKDQDISRTVPVRPDGKISLPLVGEVEAAGLTAAELQAIVTQRLAPYVQKPSVSVIVREIHSRRFFVLGQVNHPGAFALLGPTTALQAIAQAGGLAEFADENSMVLLRSTSSGVRRYPLRYDDLVGARDGRAIYLAPDDTLVVP